MFVDFYSASGVLQQVDVKLHRLAANIVTEWRPNVPSSAINGMVDVVRAFLHDGLLENGLRIWTTDEELAYTDRQWSGSTSWMLGVAFARFVMEREGYQWWAPVSAFQGTSSRGTTQTGSWRRLPSQARFTVDKRSPFKSKLLPDYVACRLRGRYYEFAFFEAKGTNRAIQKWTDAQSSWIDQVNNAELSYRGQPVPIARNAVIATRVNPAAKQLSTRKVIVRLWNRRNVTNHRDIRILGHFLSSHYAMLCRRIGFPTLAELLEQSAGRRDSRRTDRHMSRADIWRFGRMLNLREISGSALVGEALRPETNSRASFGDQTVSAGLHPAAIGVIATLLDDEWSQLPDRIETEFNLLRNTQERINGAEDFPVTLLSNGVIVFSETVQ